MALTLAQIQANITNNGDARQILNQIADYLEANPGGGAGVASIIAGTNITLGGTATNPVINASPGGSSYLVFDSVGDFPATGDEDIIYGTRDTNSLYQWNASDEEYQKQTNFKLESYENAAMSAPVLAYVFRQDGDAIVRVFEPERKNDITALTGEEADSLAAFPFDNVNWYGVISNGGRFLGKHSGSFVRNTTIENSGTINFNSKGNSGVNKSHIGQSATLLFGLDDPETVIELTMMPTSFIICGVSIEAVTLNAGGNVRGDANEFFIGVSNCVIGSNANVKPGTTNTHTLNKCTVGNFVNVTLGGDTEGCTIMDLVAMTTVGAKTNAQFLNIGGTSYEIGFDTGAATLTAV